MVCEWEKVVTEVTEWLWCRVVIDSSSSSCSSWRLRLRLQQTYDKLFIYLFIYLLYGLWHVKSFTIVKNRNCGQVTSHCRKARPYRADLSLFLDVPVVTVKSEITVWGRLFQTVGEAWQKARLEKCRTDALFCRMFSPRDRSCLVVLNTVQRRNTDMRSRRELSDLHRSSAFSQFPPLFSVLCKNTRF